MPTPTYTPLANITLGSTQASVTFSSINQGYRDVIAVYNGQTVSSGSFDIRLNLNGDTSNHSVIVMGGASSSTFSFLASSINLFNPGSDVRTIGIFQVMDYSTTDKHKSSLIRLGSAGATGVALQRWASTSAVTSVTISTGAGTFAVGSVFTLYGIAA